MVSAPALASPPPSTSSVPSAAGGTPLLGFLPAMARDPLGLIDHVRDTVGDVALLRMGPRRVLFVQDPAVIEHMLVDNVRNYTKQTRGYAQLRNMLGNGLVTSEGDFWLRQRRIAQPAFHREKIAALAAVMQRDTDEMLAQWQRRPASTAFDFADEITRLTMRIIGEALFSVDVSHDTHAAGAAINELIHQAFSRTTSLWAPPLWLPTAANRRFSAAKQLLDEMMFGIIDERRRGHAEHHDLLQMLLDAVDEETGERMTDQQLRDEVLTLFSAGHETTATLLTWTMHELLEHPDVEQRLRDELAALPSPAALASRAPYLDAVLKEALRLHPPIWMVARHIVEDDVAAGHRLRGGSYALLPQWGVHRHPKYWREPLRFLPERFLDEEAVRRLPKYAFFPFLGGTRKCIGDQFALLEAKIILAGVLRAGRLERLPAGARLPSGAAWPGVVPDPALSLRMRHGLWVRRQLPA